MYTFNGENAKIIYTESNCFDFLDFEQPKILEVVRIEVDKESDVAAPYLLSLIKKFFDENDDKLIVYDDNIIGHNNNFISQKTANDDELYSIYCNSIARELFHEFDIIRSRDIFDNRSFLYAGSRIIDIYNSANKVIYINKCFANWFVSVRKSIFKLNPSKNWCFASRSFKDYLASIKSIRAEEEKAVKEKYGSDNVYFDNVNGFWRIKATDYIVSEGYCHAKQFNV